MIKLNKNIKIDGLLFIRGKSGASVPILKVFFVLDQIVKTHKIIALNGGRLSDGHMAHIPHGAVLSQRPSLPCTPVYMLHIIWHC